ncbi:UNVERIFIED_CONTAM: DUF1989 domain-containing protein, partial [Salmonella enterica subsp. enterica serovar Weltevreden]
ANLNLFSKVVADDDGALRYVPGASKAGSQVTLRFEMDTLVLMHSVPHPLDPSPEWPAKPVSWEIFEAPALVRADVCCDSRPENARGFENNRLYQLSLREHTA